MDFSGFVDQKYHQVCSFLKEVSAFQHHKNHQYAMRIAGIEFDEKTNEAYLQVDIPGIVKHVLPRYRADELLEDDIIANFPPKHIKMITFLACKKFFEEVSQFEVISKEQVLHETIFTFQQKETGIVFRKSAQALMYNQNLFLNFSKNDIKDIVFSAAQDQYRFEEIA